MQFNGDRYTAKQCASGRLLFDAVSCRVCGGCSTSMYPDFPIDFRALLSLERISRTDIYHGSLDNLGRHLRAAFYCLR